MDLVRHDPRLARACAAIPRLRGIYAHPVPAEGGFLPDPAIVIDCDPEATDDEIHAILTAVCEVFRTARHETHEWSIERGIDVDDRVGRMRLDLYVRG